MAWEKTMTYTKIRHLSYDLSDVRYHFFDVGYSELTTWGSTFMQTADYLRDHIGTQNLIIRKTLHKFKAFWHNT